MESALYAVVVLLIHAIKENVHCNFGAKGLRVGEQKEGGKGRATAGERKISQV